MKLPDSARALIESGAPAHLVTLNPDVSYVAAMPHMVKFHIVLAFLTIGFFPFTRLVHVLVIPNPYLWRKTQVVRWYRNWSKARQAVRQS